MGVFLIRVSLNPEKRMPTASAVGILFVGTGQPVSDVGRRTSLETSSAARFLREDCLSGEGCPPPHPLTFQPKRYNNVWGPKMKVLCEGYARHRGLH